MGFIGGLTKGLQGGFQAGYGVGQAQVKQKKEEEQTFFERTKEMKEANLGLMNEVLDQAHAKGLTIKDPTVRNGFNVVANDYRRVMTKLSQKFPQMGITPDRIEAEIDAIKLKANPAEIAAQKLTLKEKETKVVEAAKLGAKAEAKSKEPKEYKRFGAFSPSLNKRFTAFDDGQGNISMLDEQGQLVDAPPDVYPASTQVTGGASETLTRKEGQELRGTQREAVASLDEASALLKRTQQTPGAGGIRGFLAEKVGGVLGQAPFGTGEPLETWFTKAIAGATPEEVNAVRTKHRVFVAQMLSAITGEESGRFSEPERQIAEKTLKGLDANASNAQIISATKTVMELSVDAELRSTEELGRPAYDLSKDSDIQRFGEYLLDLGFNEDEAISMVKERVMRKRRRK